MRNVHRKAGRIRTATAAGFARFRRCQGGVSAVEFALFAPILFFALVAAVDLGLAEYERMTIDHALRAGAQSAMADQGTDAVLKIVQNTASRNFKIADQPAPSADALTVSVARFCACQGSTGVEVACSTTCPGPSPTFIYYRLSGAKIYDGMIMPDMTLNPTVQVQIR